MPYKQRYRKRRQRRRRAITYGDIGQKVYQDVKYLKSLLNVEFQTLNTTFPASPNTTGQVINLTAIAQGDTAQSRQGNKIRLKYLKVSGVVELHASATRSRVRMVIVRDNNGSTTIPDITDLYTSLAQFFNNRNKLGTPQSNSRFSILWDKLVLIDSSGKGPMSAVKYSQSLDHHCFFTGGATTDEGKGALYLMIASDEATNDPIVTIDSTVKWIDN